MTRVLSANFGSRRHISSAYHWLFLVMSAVSFLFGIIAASVGMVFIFSHPEQSASGIAIEAVSVLGFFFARWCQKSYAPLLSHTAQTERANDLLSYSEFLQDGEVRKTIVEAFFCQPIPGPKDKIAEYNTKKTNTKANDKSA